MICLLNFCSYRSVPQKYMVPHEMPKESFEKGIDVMERLAHKVKDKSLLRLLRFYRKHPYGIVTKWVAHVLHQSAHFAFVKILTETIKKEMAVYPHRSFGKEADELFEKRIVVARKKCQELERAGAYAQVLREEPFLIGNDPMERKVYVMATWRGRVNQRVEILEY